MSAWRASLPELPDTGRRASATGVGEPGRAVSPIRTSPVAGIKMLAVLAVLPMPVPTSLICYIAAGFGLCVARAVATGRAGWWGGRG